MSDKEVFMQVAELGDLYLYDVLISYIYPRVFVCEDTYDSNSALALKAHQWCLVFWNALVYKSCKSRQFLLLGFFVLR